MVETPTPLVESLFENGAVEPPPSQFNIAQYCLQHAYDAPESVALIVITDPDAPPETWRFGDLAAGVADVAQGLRTRGLEQGERVALRLENTSRFPLLFFGVIAAGGVAVPTSPQLSESEAQFVLTDSEARFFCVDDGLDVGPTAAIQLRPADVMSAAPTAQGFAFEDTEANDPAVLVYTSGATGRPKGVLHAHRSAWARRMMWRDWYGLRPDDRVLHAGAFNWTYTLGAGLTDPWAIGATSVIYNGPKDPSVWPRLAEVSRATLFAAVPSVFRQCVKYGERLRDGFATLRHGLTAGEKLTDSVRADWRDATGLELYEALGMSECSTFISSSPTTPTRAGYVGRPQTGRRVAALPVEEHGAAGRVPVPINETGVLAIDRRDVGLMLGYWRRPEEETAMMRGEWFVTGDLVEMDADGHVAYRGRADDLMNAMGYRVAPQEIEEALAQHPAVVECAAAELQVRADARVIAAFVATHPETSVEPEALIAHCADRLAAYKTPREIIFVDALPRTPNGKIRRRDLAAAHARRTPSLTNP